MAKLSLDATGFNNVLKETEKTANKFGTNLGSSLKSQIAGAFTVGTLVALGRTAIETASRVQDLSEQFDISTDAVQRIDFALKQGGLSFEDFGTAMDKFGAIRKKAAAGDAESIAMLSQFGITLDEIKNPLATNLELTEKLVNAMKGLKLTSAQRQDMREILGKSGARLITAMQGAGSDAPFQASPGQIGKVEGAGDWISKTTALLKNALVRGTANALDSPWKLMTPVALLASIFGKQTPGAGASGSWGEPGAPDTPVTWEDVTDKYIPNKHDAPAHASHASFAGDSLANVGGFVGGAGGGGGGPTDILKQSLKVQVASKDYLREMSQNKATF